MYVVLKKIDHPLRAPGEAWEVVLGNADVKSPREAISLAVGTGATGGGAGTYVAIPSKSWKPRDVAQETVTRLVWGGGSPGEEPEAGKEEGDPEA